ncbi:MAG TPA: PAS domain S-box protein [Longimicrobiales bacterium]
MSREVDVIRILLVEDESRSARRVHECLAGADGPRFVIVQVGLVVDAVTELAGADFDVVLLDPSLPDAAAGAGAFARLYAAAPDVPILILAERSDELSALKAVHAGAVDYILKDQLTPILLGRAVRYAVERGRTDEALRRAADENSRLAAAVENLATGVVITDPNAPDHPVVFANAGFVRMTGYDAAEVMGRNLRLLQGPDTDPVAVDEIRQAVAARRPCEVVLLNYRKDGTAFWNQLTISPVHNEDGTLVHFIGLQTDVSDRIAAEAAIAERNRELAALHRISTISLAPDSPDRSFHAIAEEIAAATGFPIVAIERYDEASQQMVCRYARGVPEGSVPPASLDRTPAGRVVRTREPVFTCADEPVEPAEGVLHGLGIRTLACVPMEADGRVIGTLTLAHTAAVPLDERLPRFAASIAGLVASLVERTRAEEALAAEGERLAVTLRSIAEGVVATDTDGRITLMNRVAEELSGWSQADAAGRPLMEVVRVLDEDTREPRDLVRRLFDGARPPATVKEQGILVARDGTERIVAESIAPLSDQAGAVVGAVLAFRDITRERELEEELLRASKLESLGILAGGIAHDFNNLLTSILGHLSLLRSDPAAASAGVIGEAEEAARKARALTQQLLTFSVGGAPIRRRAAIADVVRDAVRLAGHGSAIDCDLDLESDLHPVAIDEGQIAQALGNILLNARQAMPDGGTIRVTGGNVRIDAGSEDAGSIPLPPGDYVRISIRDEGQGIAPEHLPRIFDPYFTTRPNASGLGLAAAYSIVRKHGGHVTARSEPGVGATFEVLLPALEDAGPAPAANPPPAGPPRSGRVLVMDDDTVVLSVVRRMLERIGYDVETAADGEAAVARYREAMAAGSPFDVVLMDLTVPGGMGGRDAIRHLLEIDPDVRAIVSSGYSNDPVMAEYRAHGFRGVIAKPYDLGELRRIMAEVLAG